MPAPRVVELTVTIEADPLQGDVAVGELNTLVFGYGLTDTVTVAVLPQPARVIPVTVYVVVIEGLATGPAHVPHDNPAEGAQE